MVFDESMLINKEDMIVKKEDTIVKEDAIVNQKFDNDIYRKKIIPHIEKFKNLIKDSGSGEIEIKIKDLKNLMGNEFKDRNVNSFYSMLKLILIEGGVKVRLHHYYGANVIMSFASEGEVVSSIEIVRRRMAKTAKNAGYENYADYLINTPYHGSRWNITNKEDNRYFVVIGKKFIASILFPGAIIDDHSYVNRYTEYSGYDWMTSDGLKVKHFGSRLKHRVEEGFLERDYFQWGINENDVPDIFVLTGWEKKSDPELLKGWIFDKNEVVNGRKFWDRESFLISTHDRSINKYSKYEIDDDKLENIRRKIRDARQISMTFEDINIVDYRLQIAEWHKTYFRYMG